MNASKHGAVDVTLLAASWGPRLTRFYFFICADQSVAESSAVETLAQAIGSRRMGTSPSALVRLAVARSTQLRCGTPNGDRIARAVATLPIRQRIVVALVQGMGIGIDQVADATGTSLSESKRLFADGLLEVHRLLFKNPDPELENSSEI